MSRPATYQPTSYTDMLIAKLRADNKALLEIVKFVEWRGHNQVCPVCHGSKYKGHGAACNIGKAIAEHSEPQ